MRWLDYVRRDPVPWLLDPVNPSVRYLTLRDIFRKPDSELIEEQQRVLDWAPVVKLRTHWDPLHHWGRAGDPYYGGPLGTLGTLYLLAQLGAPPFSEAQASCEQLLAYGRRNDGYLAPRGGTAIPPIGLTGMALRILHHFGFGDHPITQAACRRLVATVQQAPDTLGQAIADHATCAAAIKALESLLRMADTVEDRTTAMEILGRYLLAYPYDWAGRDARWLILRFPRFYDSDLSELCHTLAQTPFRETPEFEGLVQRLGQQQNAEGYWVKRKPTLALDWEPPMHPSRWLTYEAIHTLILTYGDDRYAP